MDHIFQPETETDPHRVGAPGLYGPGVLAVVVVVHRVALSEPRLEFFNPNFFPSLRYAFCPTFVSSLRASGSRW